MGFFPIFKCSPNLPTRMSVSCLKQKVGECQRCLSRSLQHDNTCALLLQARIVITFPSGIFTMLYISKMLYQQLFPKVSLVLALGRWREKLMMTLDRREMLVITPQWPWSTPAQPFQHFWWVSLVGPESAPIPAGLSSPWKQIKFEVRSTDSNSLVTWKSVSQRPASHRPACENRPDKSPVFLKGLGLITFSFTLLLK